MCKVYTGYRSTSEIEHGLCACTVDNPLALTCSSNWLRFVVIMLPYYLGLIIVLLEIMIVTVKKKKDSLKLQTMQL